MPFLSVFSAVMCSPSLKMMSVLSLTVIRLLQSQATSHGHSHGESCPWTSTALGVSNLELKLQSKRKNNLLSRACISSLNGKQEGLLCSDSGDLWQLPASFAWWLWPRRSPLGSYRPKLNRGHLNDLVLLSQAPSKGGCQPNPLSHCSWCATIP